MKKVFPILFFLLITVGAFAQMQPADAPVRFAKGITAAELRAHLSVIASDEFQGRETGKPGQRKAAAYIADYFKDLKLPTIGTDNSYYQPISFIAEYWADLSLSVDDKKLRHLWEYYAYPSTNIDQEPVSFSEAVFVGYGIETDNYSDYKKAEVAGKLVVAYAGEPVSETGISQITGDDRRSEWSTDWRRKIRLAKEKGAAAILFIDTDFTKNVQEARKLILNSSMHIGTSEKPEEYYIPNYFVTSEVARTLFGDDLKKIIKRRDKMQKKGKSKPVTFECDVVINQEKRVRQLTGENVLGFIEGTDPEKKDEVVVITAHYDHLGMRGPSVYNGADDNGSGTSSVLEICQAFVEAKAAGAGPKRSVLCMLVSGEEKGLLGSEYYAANPVFPLEQTVVNVNVDMVGRVDQAHANNPDYIYVIGADRLSSELHEINEAANKTYTQLELDYTYNDENDPNRYYYRSDHYNFAKNGIPAIFYFNGTHEDYHRTTDTVDKINFAKMEKIARLVFYTSWELANREKRIEVDKK